MKRLLTLTTFLSTCTFGTLIGGAVGGATEVIPSDSPSSNEIMAMATYANDQAHGYDGSDFAGEMADLLSDNVSLYVDLMVAELEDYDMDEAAGYAVMLADEFEEMHDEGQLLPGASSPLGVATLKAFSTCEEAYDHAAVVLAAGNISALDVVTVEIDTCANGMTEAAALIEGLGEV